MYGLQKLKFSGIQPDSSAGRTPVDFHIFVFTGYQRFIAGWAVHAAVSHDDAGIMPGILII